MLNMWCICHHTSQSGCACIPDWDVIASGHTDQVLQSDFILLCRYVGLPRLLFLSLPSIKAYVRYDLVLFPCTIRSGCVLVYDINLGATHTTILSIRGVTIPIYLVSSTTDFIR